MSKITRRVAGHAAALLLASGTAGLAGGTQNAATGSVVLVCESAVAGFCPVLLKAAREIDPGRKVRTARGAPVTAKADLVLRYVEELGDANAIAGHLAWETADGRTGRGESLELSVMDARLGRDMLTDFAFQLLKGSELPLQRR